MILMVIVNYVNLVIIYKIQIVPKFNKDKK